MFNLYFAGAATVDDLLQDLGCKRLFSQFNDKSSIKKWIEDWDKTGRRHTLFVDSGAYTARTKGVEIDLDKYIEYLNENKGRFEVIAPLDVIPNESTESQLDAPEKSWQNYLIMKERVIDSDKVIPAFHMGEDYKYLHTAVFAAEGATRTEACQAGTHRHAAGHWPAGLLPLLLPADAGNRPADRLGLLAAGRDESHLHPDSRGCLPEGRTDEGKDKAR